MGLSGIGRGRSDEGGHRGALPAAVGITAAALVLIAVGPLASGAAAATPTWLAPTDIGPDGETGGVFESPPNIAIDPAGDVTAVWAHVVGAEADVEAASRPAGGPWEASANISGPSESGLSGTGGVGVDAAGDATAIWLGQDGGSQVVKAATRPAGGAWGPPTTLSAPSAAFALPRIAVDPAGEATAVWVFEEGGGRVIQSATKPAGGDWGTPVQISAPGAGATEPEIAVDGAGDLTAVWIATEGGNGVVVSADRTPGGAWSQPVEVSPAQQAAGEPQIGVNRAGDAAAVWVGTEGTATIRAATRPAGGTWGPSAELSGPVGSFTFADVGVDDEGNVTALWTTSDTLLPPGIVQSASRPAGGPWGAPVDLSTGDANIEPDLAVDGAGETIAIWRTIEGEEVNAVKATIRLPGGAWSVPSDIGSSSTEPAAVVDPEGDAAAIWYTAEAIEGGATFRYAPQVAGLDAAAPRLSSLSIPSTGTAGQPTSFSVSPLDVWSAVGTAWDFGDGTGGEGAAVAHTYARPGTYTVTVTATDAVGFSSSATGTIVVSPATASPPADASRPPEASAPSHHPRVKITHRPRHRHKGKGKGSPRYAFRFYDETPGARYSCSLDGVPFRPCTSPKVYRHLKPGKHVFRVRSVDADGVTSPARTVRFEAAGKRR